MKRSSSLLLIFLLTLITAAVQSVFGQAEKEYFTPGQKSIHLFNLPDGISESQLVESLAELNQSISDVGYPGIGYQLYKVENDSIQEHRYFVEGLWPDPETYRVVHDHEAWKQVAEKHAEMWDKIQAMEIYRRVVKVDMNN